MDELLIYLENNYSQKIPTLNQYKRHYNKLKNFGDFDLDNDNDCLDIINKDMSLSSKLGLLNLMIIYRSKVKMENVVQGHPLVDCRTEIKNEEKIKKIEKNDMIKSQLPTRDQLQKYLHKQFQSGNYKNYIVNYLLLNFYVRNVDCNVLLFKNQDPCCDDINYLVYYDATPNYVIWKRNKYKTINLYGKQEHKIWGRSISGKNFCNAVREFYDTNDGNNNTGVPLFKTTSNKQVSDANCGWYVANSTYQGIGEGKYLKIMLNDINNQPNTMNILNKISASRGTGAKHLITDYNITQSVNDILQ
jgi:hypothetical protein